MLNPGEYKLEKSELRRQIIKQRQSLSEAEWKEKSQEICQNLAKSDLYIKSKTVLGYFSFRREPDLSYLFSENKLDSSKNWGFPRCVDKSLIWHFWKSEDELITGKYGIREPNTSLPIVKPENVDLILVPCVACDYQNYRLGYGGGYYDRFLSSPECESIPTIGIVFDLGYLPEVPIEAWDKKLDKICTETGLKG